MLALLELRKEGRIRSQPPSITQSSTTGSDKNDAPAALSESVLSDLDERELGIRASRLGLELVWDSFQQNLSYLILQSDCSIPR